MLMPITSSRSAVQSVPLWLRSPFGAFNPVTQLADTTRPSPVSCAIRPLPSRASGAPPICELKTKPDPSSIYTLSGVAIPSVALQPADSAAAAGAGGVAAPVDSAGDVLPPPHADKFKPDASTRAIDRKRTEAVDAMFLLSLSESTTYTTTSWAVGSVVA